MENETNAWPSLGQVIFMEYDEKNHVFYEIGRTMVIDAYKALMVYAETPNPASQLLNGKSKEEIAVKYNQLMIDCKRKQWVDELLNCI